MSEFCSAMQFAACTQGQSPASGLCLEAGPQTTDQPLMKDGSSDGQQAKSAIREFVEQRSQEASAYSAESCARTQPWQNMLQPCNEEEDQVLDPVRPAQVVIGGVDVLPSYEEFVQLLQKSNVSDKDWDSFVQNANQMPSHKQSRRLQVCVCFHNALKPMTICRSSGLTCHTHAYISTIIASTGIAALFVQPHILHQKVPVQITNQYLVPS